MNAAYRQSQEKSTCPVPCANCGITVGISKPAKERQRRNPGAVNYYCFACGEAGRRVQVLTRQLEEMELTRKVGPYDKIRLELASAEQWLKSAADRRKPGATDD